MEPSKFQVGARVERVRESNSVIAIGWKGAITKVNGENCQVMWDNSTKYNNYYNSNEFLKHIETLVENRLMEPTPAIVEPESIEPFEAFIVYSTSTPPRGSRQKRWTPGQFINVISTYGDMYKCCDRYETSNSTLVHKSEVRKVMNLNQSLPDQPPKELSTMSSLKIHTTNVVSGMDTSKLTPEQTSNLILTANSRIRGLKEVKPTTKAINKLIRTLEDELDLFITHMDSLDT